MIEFRPIEPADKALIESYVRPGSCRNCDMSFANMFCWSFLYRSARAVVDGFLIIRFRIDGGRRLGYMQPLGEGDFGRILPLLAEDAHRHGQRLRLIGLCEEGVEKVRAAGCGEFAFHADRNLSDYIYRVEDLRTLSGRRYQSKRNHINRFRSTYDYRYEPLARERFAECMRLEAEWRSAHTGHRSELSAEQHAMRTAFDHFEELELSGGCLYVADRLVAFTYGSPINHDTFDCHVEKADTEYDGAFAMINKLFAEHLPPGYEYINREEDLGLDGLRQAKLSYHPALLLDKYTAIRLHDDERAVKKLWKEVFGDDDAFIDAFLMRYYSRKRALLEQRDGRLCAMLHTVPFATALGRTCYVCGVATAPEMRRQGLAGELMRQAIARSREQGFQALMLVPATRELRDYYARFGFRGDIPVQFASPDGFDFGTGDSTADRAMVLPLDASDEALPDLLEARYEADE